MVETITPLRLHLLQMIAKFPDVTRAKLLDIKGITEADLAYLVQHDLVRERDGRLRVTHFGQMALKRGV
jgi:hypothetical protein